MQNPSGSHSCCCLTGTQEPSLKHVSSFCCLIKLRAVQAAGPGEGRPNHEEDGKEGLHLVVWSEQRGAGFLGSVIPAGMLQGHVKKGQGMKRSKEVERHHQGRKEGKLGQQPRPGDRHWQGRPGSPQALHPPPFRHPYQKKPGWPGRSLALPRFLTISRAVRNPFWMNTDVIVSFSSKFRPHSDWMANSWQTISKEHLYEPWNYENKTKQTIEIDFSFSVSGQIIFIKHFTRKLWLKENKREPPAPAT